MADSSQSFLIVVLMVSILILVILLIAVFLVGHEATLRQRKFIAARLNYTIDSVKHIVMNNAYAGHYFYLHSEVGPTNESLHEITVKHRESVYYTSYNQFKHLLVIQGMEFLQWQDVESLLTLENNRWVHRDKSGYYISQFRLHKPG